MKCFYHNDVDGKCAGAIVKKWYKEQWRDDGRDSYFSINYDVNFPFDIIKPNEQVIIVDFSLRNHAQLQKLMMKTKDIIWIDHHKTAIEKFSNFVGLAGEKISEINGIREDGKAGCELAWKHFYSQKPYPLAVKYAGRYDVWDFSEFGENLNIFQAGIRLDKHNPEDDIWNDLLKYNHGSGLREIMINGKIALKFRTNRYKSLIKAFSFYAEFEGLKAICCNVGSTSSQLFDSVDEDSYEIMIPFVASDRGWTLSLYTKKDIDCSEIAKKYGGGGHKKAAGFQCKQLFIKNGKLEILTLV